MLALNFMAQAALPGLVRSDLQKFKSAYASSTEARSSTIQHLQGTIFKGIRVGQATMRLGVKVLNLELK
jgi:hypothetical protein